MKREIRILGLFFVGLLITGCNTETHSNPIGEIEIDNTDKAEITFDIYDNDELRHKLMGSWTLNADTGQKDFNEDGSYKSCELFVAGNDNSETEFCSEGNWSINEGGLRIVLESGDTVNNTIMWVFDNVVYLGVENDGVNKENAWEFGMTKI